MGVRCLAIVQGVVLIKYMKKFDYQAYLRSDVA
jgi:hypothetical protein